MAAIDYFRTLYFILISSQNTKKSENSSYISSNYYNTCKLLTTKEAKMRKLREEEKEGRGLYKGVREERQENKEGLTK